LWPERRQRKKEQVCRVQAGLPACQGGGGIKKREGELIQIKREDIRTVKEKGTPRMRARGEGLSSSVLGGSEEKKKGVKKRIHF